LAAGLLAIVAMLTVSWFLIEWNDDGADAYAGGVVIRDSAGRIMRVSLGADDVDCRPFYRAAPEDWIVKALVAAEDGTFWEHRGVRPFSVLRAAFQNLTTGRRISGASTITMQAVRLIKPHPKTLWRKYVEAFQAMKMERQKDKLWILSQYLNRAPFGANFIGIEAAANGWFGKGAKELGLAEAACLAGMVQAPSRFRPDRAAEKAVKRREYVLERMLKLGYIDEEQRKAAAGVSPTVSRAPRPFDCPYYCDWVIRTLGETANSRCMDLATPLDADIQRRCEKVVNDAAAKGGYSSAAVVMRVSDGAVLALACSGNYFGNANGQVNTAIARRPVGSTLKPFLTALAFDRGLSTPEERLADLPRVYKGYSPSNFDNQYRGLVTVRDSLVMSLNIPFVQLLQRVGVPEFATTLRAMGCFMPALDETYGLGLAVGDVDLSLMELVTAYATIARGGTYLPPKSTLEPKATTGGAEVRIFSQGAAYLVSDILSGDERSLAALGHIADVETSRFAWKTGTSSAYRDAWTIAWNPEYVIGVWCGHKFGGFGDRSLVGAKASAPLCWKVARSLYPQNNGPWFVEPEGVFRRRVCAKSGLPAGVGCEATEEGRALSERTPDIKCRLCQSAAKEKLMISKPENKAVFCMVRGMDQQRIICRVIGVTPKERLWWFVDGVPSGETMGTEAHVLEMSEGCHAISCATKSGETSWVEILVRK